MARDSFYSFLRVRPLTIGDALRLYVGFAASFLLKITRLKRRLKNYQNPGAFVPGSSKMRVRVGSVLAMIRPKTGDLVIISGLHEPLATSWFKAKEGQTVVDIGAHIGRYALEAASKAAIVIAVEPDPSNFKLLEQNIRINGFRNVALLNAAVSSSAGRRTLYPQIGDNTGTSSLEPGWVPRARREVGVRGTSVECRTLDDIVSSFHIESIDWLKLDVEGHEVHVLEGGRNALSLTRNLIVEVSEENKKKCMQLIKMAGLRVESIEEGARVSNWLCRRPLLAGSHEIDS